jgi:RNA polymerase sigma factor (sigma-70 family)
MKLNLSNDTAKTELSQVGDTNLMLRFQSGDEACFRELVKRHRQRVYDYVYRLFRGSEESEEIARDLFAELYRRRDSFRTSMNFKNWLMALCRELCHGYLAPRKLTAVRARLRQGGRPRKLPHAGCLAAAHASAFTDAALNVKKRVDLLSVADRELLILSRYAGCSHETIGELTGMSAEEVRLNLNRVKLSLTESMRELLE